MYTWVVEYMYDARRLLPPDGAAAEPTCARARGAACARDAWMGAEGRTILDIRIPNSHCNILSNNVVLDLFSQNEYRFIHDVFTSCFGLLLLSCFADTLT
eukprot:COSAG02_NODE_8516_length_2540_cov_5.095043_3_plen_100_part_00